MIQVVSGNPGCGKSYYLAWIARQALRSRRPVFSIMPILRTLALTEDMIADNTFPAGSLIVIDEAQLFYNSRLWADMDQDQMRYYAQHRHDGVDIVFATQHPARLDGALREIASEFVWLRSWGPPMDRVVKSLDPETGLVVDLKKRDKRAILMKGEVVESYDAWGIVKKNWVDLEGYRRWWHLVKPSVFKSFNSYDMSQLSDRDLAPVIHWEDVLSGKVKLPPPKVREKGRKARPVRIDKAKEVTA